ncbi:MAG: LysM peptidoglycan-binding domain-containing protein [Candidatus Sericytochromatia bacterium]|nr:LysM peptidoglycan-binding domain-containing protein [Candidatus Sericytochromatia bacterium]
MADSINPSAPRAGTPTARNAPPAPREAAPAAPTPTSDAFVRQDSGTDIATLASLVAQLQTRITAVERRVATLANEESFAPVPLGALARTGSQVWREALPPVPPPAPARAQASAAPPPARQPQPTTYTVRPGDTLWTIAGRQLGDPTRFRELIALNREALPSLEASPDFLRPGWALTLPGDAAPAARPAGAKPVGPTSEPEPPASRPAGTSGAAPAGEPEAPSTRPRRSRRPSGEPNAPRPANQAKPEPRAVVPEVLPPEAAGEPASTGQAAKQRPAAQSGQPLPVAVPNPADLGIPGFDPTRGFVVERQETRVEAVETETDTRWEVGPDGKATASRQQTDVTAAETVTRTRWRARDAQQAPSQPPTAIAPPGDKPPTTEQPPAGDKPPTAAKPPAGDKPPATNKPPSADKPPAGDKPPAKPDDLRRQRLQQELDVYLGEHKNSSAIVSLAESHPAYLEAATLPQKARMVRQALSAVFTDKADRAAALKVLRAAHAQGELLGVMNQLHEQKKLSSAIRSMSGSDQGREMAKLLQEAGLYENSGIVQAMDADAVSDLVGTLGWRHPMIGLSDALSGLPDSHKKAMIAKLLEGDFSLAQHRQASWLNQHLAQPVRLPAYDPHPNR